MNSVSAPAATAPLAVDLLGLRKQFGKRVALDGIDVALPMHVIVGVVGPDGAGKTTFVRTLAGLLEIEAKRAMVLGYDLVGDVTDLKRAIGYVPQAFSLHRDLSVIENLQFTARLQRIPADVFEERSRELLQRTGLARFQARVAGALSGGMKQKLAVANALLTRPRLLLLDEPTAGVDVTSRAEIWEMLEAARDHALVVISTSYLDEAEACDRLLYFNDGKLVANGTPAELCAQTPVSLYRIWSPDPATAAEAAATLPYSTTVRRIGASVRLETNRGVLPSPMQLRQDLQTAGAPIDLVEELPPDMESMLLAVTNPAAGHAASLSPRSDSAARTSARVTGAPVIRVRNLTKRFGDFTAVDSLDITVPEGSIFAFLGANGSGKSTTIRMLIGLLEPTGGEIEVDGIDVMRHPRRVRDHIGYMGQKVSLYQGLSLWENVEFYAGLFDLDRDTLRKRWDGLRSRFDLADVERERTEDLPAGIRQRAGLALSILHRPRVLFLDEPTAGVDVHSRNLFWELIEEEANSGVTVFVTTHFLEEVDYCDWVSFIDAGRLIADAAPEELRRTLPHAYRIEVGGRAAASGAAARELAPYLPGAETLRGVVRGTIARPEPPLVEALGRLQQEFPDSPVGFHPAAMSEVFRHVIRSRELAQ